MQNKLIEAVKSEETLEGKKGIIKSAIEKGEDAGIKLLFAVLDNELKAYILAEIIDKGKNTLLDNLWNPKSLVVEQAVIDDAFKLALHKGAKQTISILLKKGASQSLVGTIKNPLMDAIEKDDIKKARELIEQKPTIIIDEIEVAIQFGKADLLIEMLSKANSRAAQEAMNFAIQYGKINCLNAILDFNPSQLHKNAALSFAIATYRDQKNDSKLSFEAIELLVSAGAMPSENDLFKQGIDSKISAKGVEKEIAEIILPNLKTLSLSNAIKLLMNQNLIDEKLWNRLDKNVQSSLEAAYQMYENAQSPDALINNFDNIRELQALMLCGANPDKLCSNGKTPLLTAIESGNDAAVRFFLSVSSLVVKDNQGKGLMECAKTATPAVQKLINEHITKQLFKAAISLSGKDELNSLIELGVDINQIGPDGTTALMEAVRAGNSILVKALLEHGADPKIKDGAGNGLDKYLEKVILKLEEQKAKGEPLKGTDVATFNLIVSHLETISHEMAAKVAKINADSRVLEFTNTNIEVGVRLEIAHQMAMVMMYDKERPGVDALETNIDHVEKITALLLAGANPNTLSSKGSTALITAVKNNQVQAVYQLMIHGADLYVKDTDGKTAFDYVSSRNGDVYNLFQEYTNLEKQFKNKFENNVVEAIRVLGSNPTAEALAGVMDEALKEAYKPGFAEKLKKGERPIISKEILGNQCEFAFVEKFFMWLESWVGEHTYQELKALKISDRVYNNIYNTEPFHRLSKDSDIAKDAAKTFTEKREAEYKEDKIFR